MAGNNPKHRGILHPIASGIYGLPSSHRTGPLLVANSASALWFMTAGALSNCHNIDVNKFLF